MKNCMIRKIRSLTEWDYKGDAMTVAVCTDNERIDEDIKLFS